METAAFTVDEVLQLIAFALGAETAEGQHLAGQRDRIAAGIRPSV